MDIIYRLFKILNILYILFGIYCAVIFSIVYYSEDEIKAQICKTHIEDYNILSNRFSTQLNSGCMDGCILSPEMVSLSDDLHRIAGEYYLMDCDVVHGRL